MPGIKKTMGEFKEGKLKSSSGKKVTDRDQAIAIGLSQEGKPRKMASGGSVCSRPTGQGYRASRKPKGMA
jgi:hypothetical protein